MDSRLKFYGWGVENTGLNEAEREQLFRFIADRLWVKDHLDPEEEKLRFSK